MTVNYVNEYTFSERSMRQKRGLFHEGTEEKCCEIVKLIPGSPAGSRRGFDRIGPVSYTHLDVYKRQVFSRQGFACFSESDYNHIIFVHDLSSPFICNNYYFSYYFN